MIAANIVLSQAWLMKSPEKEARLQGAGVV